MHSDQDKCTEVPSCVDKLMEAAIREYADEYHGGDWEKVPVAAVKGIGFGVAVARRDRESRRHAG